MTPTLDWSRILPLLIPILIIQLGMQIFALVDLARAEKVSGNKWAWAAIIVLGEILGPIAYFLIGRREA